tara:strand:- start:1784 stop:2698 length:915 start_codon:yes stop_codon:yes gene_type:complete
MNIFCSVSLNEIQKDFLKKKIDDNFFFLEDSREKSFENFMNCEICFGNPEVDWVKKSKNLKWIQLESVGFEKYTKIKIPGLKISNLRGFFSIPVAETALAGILSLKRGIYRLSSLKDKKKWLGSRIRPTLNLLNGSNVLILGAGSIGSKIKTLLEKFNCKILMYDKFKNDADLLNINDLDIHLPDVDILIGCLPENYETRQLLDNYRINLLKKSSIIVNVGRGSLIDEKTLIKNIKSEKLAGAFLDVTDKEPISDDSPLWSIPNIILSQHSGGGYESEVNDKILFFKENLSRYKNKILPKNIVL